jgi:hypothetical protein
MAAGPDELDYKMAIAHGLGLTAEDAADAAGLSRGSFYQRSDKKPDFYEKWRSWASMIAARTIAKEVVKAKSSASNEEKLVQRFDAALSILDKAIQKVDSLGDEATLKDLNAAVRNITHFVAKFAASEAPKRIDISGKVTQEVRIAPTALFQRVATFALRNQRYLNAAQDALEAEVVEEPVPAN